MVLATCLCLNVKINIQDSDLEDASNVDCSRLGRIDDEFFRSDVRRVHLLHDGIQQEHIYLVEIRLVGECRVYRCIVCGLSTHAIESSSNQDTVLVSDRLIMDPANIERLYNASDYSPSMKLSLDETADPSAPQQMATCNLDFLHYLQQDVDRYLVTEEANMEERIKKYEENERAQFMEQQVRVRSDKKKLLSLVLKNSTENSRSTTSPKKTLSHSLSTPLHLYEQNRNQRNYKNDFNSPQDNRARSALKSVESELLDDEDLFHFEASDETYAMSEDDGQDTDDSSAIECSSSPSQFSTSVPVNVPMWKNKDNSPAIRNNETDDDRGHPDIDQIHANMQALAKSVHDSSKEIFGDLPRPRMHTFSGRMGKR